MEVYILNKESGATERMIRKEMDKQLFNKE